MICADTVWYHMMQITLIQKALTDIWWNLLHHHMIWYDIGRYDPIKYDLILIHGNDSISDSTTWICKNMICYNMIQHDAILSHKAIIWYLTMWLKLLFNNTIEMWWTFFRIWGGPTINLKDDDVKSHQFKNMNDFLHLSCLSLFIMINL